MSRHWYPFALTTAAAVLGGVGLLAGVALIGTWSLVMILATATCLAVAWCAAAADLRGRRARFAPTVGAVALVLVSGTGLVIVFGGVAVLVVLSLAAAAVPLVLLRHRFLPADELRRRWVAGGGALAAAGTPALAAAVVRERARCLDELERRDPGAVERLLASGDPFATFGEPA